MYQIETYHTIIGIYHYVAAMSQIICTGFPRSWKVLDFFSKSPGKSLVLESPGKIFLKITQFFHILCEMGGVLKP